MDLLDIIGINKNNIVDFYEKYKSEYPKGIMWENGTPHFLFVRNIKIKSILFSGCICYDNSGKVFHVDMGFQSEENLSYANNAEALVSDNKKEKEKLIVFFKNEFNFIVILNSCLVLLLF